MASPYPVAPRTLATRPSRRGAGLATVTGIAGAIVLHPGAGIRQNLLAAHDDTACVAHGDGSRPHSLVQATDDRLESRGESV